MRPVLWSLVLALTACGAQMGAEEERGEVFSVPTGRPGELYIVDSSRGLCFFHTMVGWRGALTPIDCASLPEARPYLVEARADPAPADVAAYGDDEWRAFPEAWIEATCARLAGEPLDLPALLARYGLDAPRYHAMLGLASSDPAYWTDLNEEARRRCSAGASEAP